MDWRSAAAGCLIAAGGVSSLNAQEKVTLAGCPTTGVEMNCLMLKARDNGDYDISAAKPRPRVGYLAVQLSGTKSKKVGICQQGVILEDIQWSYTEKKCD
jgi:hypothetical protein